MSTNDAAGRRLGMALIAAALLCLAGAAGAQEKTSESDVAAQANNPLAKFQAFNLHNYYIPTMSEAAGQTANTFWLRYAQPVGRWLAPAFAALVAAAGGR